jgi:Bacterial Ig-like domain (group 3)/MBG domain (YGX type)/PQQ enzyme repeat
LKTVSQAFYRGFELRNERTNRSIRIVPYLLFLLLFGANALGQVNVYTRSYDNSRTGDNLQESTLTKANVNAVNFGKLFTVHTDGEIFAQPLYVSNLTINGAVHNVVFVASMRNTIYAIDATSGTVLWSQNYGTPIYPPDVETDQNVSWSTRIGILSTPVIDPATNYMYFVEGIEPLGTTNVSYQLNAIDITTGEPVHGSPVTISGSYQTADLTAPITFNATIENQRPALGLANGNVYIAFSSHEDQNAYHGWVFAYSISTLAQTGVYSDTTIGTLGGIWQAGQGPAIDANGNVYYSTGNGSFGLTPNDLPQTGNSFIKLSPNLALEDYFTPSDSAANNSYDWDLGAGGLMLLPNTNYAVGGGKPGILFMADTTNMGKFNASTDQVHQEFQAVYGNGTQHIHGGPVYFDSTVNGPSIFLWGENDKLRAFQYNASTGYLNTTPFATGTMTAPAYNANGAMPGGFLSISADGSSNGILWASTPYNADALKNLVPGVLYAFDADTLQLLWTDKTNDARDEVGTFAKYVPPVVANGKMYVPNFGALGTTDGSGNLLCYGLLLPTLTVNVANATMTAGSTLPAFSGTVTGLQNGDTVGTTITVTYSTTATTASPAGTYPITATVTGSSAANYSVTVNAGTLTITTAAKPTLTVSAANATRAYNTANPTFTGTVTGQQNGDTFTETFTNTATTASPVGTYAIVPTAAGTDLGNYNVVTNNGTLTITQAVQTITFGAIGAKVYGNSPFAVTATSSAGANYPVTIAVQSGPATIAGGTATLTGEGTVVLKATQAGDTNYAAGTATQSFAVTQAQLTTTANNATRVYNTANPAFSGAVTGAVGSDTFTETFTTAATTTSNVGTYPILPAVTGANLANYTVNAVNGTLTVTGAPTITTLTAPTTASGGNSVALTATVTSPAGTPGGTVTFYSGTTALGTGTLNGSGMVTLTTAALATGTDSLTASYPATGNFAASTSAPASIYVSAPSQTINFPAIGSKVYGSAPFAVSATSSLGSSYPVSITVQSGPATINAGTVTVSAVGTVVLLATQAGDATHAKATATQSFQVTMAPLALTAANASRAYGAANPTFTGTVTGAVGSDSFTETFTTTATSTSNAGTYPIVPAVTGPTANYTVTLTNGTLTVTGTATTTTVSAPSTANSGASVTITATVASGAGTPSGTVTFTSGTTALGTGTLSGGKANVNTTALPVGTDTVTATYAASGNFSGSSGTATVDVSAPATTTPDAYTISASPSSLSMKTGGTSTTMLTLTPSGGYTGTVALTCTGLPANASCSFAQNQIKLTGNNQAVNVGLTIATVSPSAVLAMRSTPASPGLLAVAFYWPGGLTGLAVFLRKRKTKRPRLAQFCLLLLCTCAVAAGLSGCGMSSTIGTQNAQVTVVATDTSASKVSTQSTILTLTVTP